MRVVVEHNERVFIHINAKPEHYLGPGLHHVTVGFREVELNRYRTDAIVADLTYEQLALVPAGAIDVVVHGAGALTPARQGVRDGKRADLSPGPADASPRLPQTRAPSAGLLVIRGSTWSWRPLVDER